MWDRMSVQPKQSILKLGLVLLLAYQVSAIGNTRSLQTPEDVGTVLGHSGIGCSQILTLGVSFLEGIAGVHEAGGCIVLALELQVQLGSLAESAPSS